MAKKKPAPEPVAPVPLDWLADANHDPTSNLFAQREHIARSSPIISDPQARRALKPGLHQPARKPPASEVGFLSAPVESAFPDTNLAQHPELSTAVAEPAPTPEPTPRRKSGPKSPNQRQRDIMSLAGLTIDEYCREMRTLGHGLQEEWLETEREKCLKLPQPEQEKCLKDLPKDLVEAHRRQRKFSALWVRIEDERKNTQRRYKDFPGLSELIQKAKAKNKLQKKKG